MNNSTAFAQVAALVPVITGDRYSDLISSAALHLRAAFILAEIAPGMAENHARAAFADTVSARVWANPAALEAAAVPAPEPTPEPPAKKSGKRYAVVTAPDGTQFVRQTERTYTHAVLFIGNDNKTHVANYCGSRALADKAAAKSLFLCVYPVTMMDKRPK